MKDCDQLFKKLPHPEINTGITTNSCGDFGLYSQPGEQECLQNSRVMEVMNNNCFLKIIPEHKDSIHTCGEITFEENYSRGDALIWQDVGDGARPILMSNTADCPILTIKGKKVLAIIHSGRKGTELKIVNKVLRVLEEEYFQKPENLKCFLWPGICQLCYELEKDLVQNFPEESIAKFKNNGKVNLDLQGSIIKQLIKGRISPQNFFTLNYCSKHSTEGGEPLFFSFRREKTQKRNLVFISL